MLKSTSLSAFLTAAILIATTAGASAMSVETEHADIAIVEKYIIVAEHIFLWVCAFLGLVLLGVGVARIAAARSERRKQPPTRHYRYSEGIWRVVVGLGLVVIPIISPIMAPVYSG